METFNNAYFRMQHLRFIIYKSGLLHFIIHEFQPKKETIDNFPNYLEGLYPKYVTYTSLDLDTELKIIHTCKTEERFICRSGFLANFCKATDNIRRSSKLRKFFSQSLVGTCWTGIIRGALSRHFCVNASSTTSENLL